MKHSFIFTGHKCCYDNNNNFEDCMNLRSIISLILLLACCCAPVLGASKYTGGSPDLSAAISGRNEFAPGQDATISIVVQNSGINTFKFVSSGTIEPDDLPNTAKQVTIWLEPGSAPVTVRTDPQMAGDIRGAGSVTVRVSARIANDAAAGEYDIPLMIQYSYLGGTEQDASDQIQFLYTMVNQTIPLTIRIKPQVTIDVLEAVPEALTVGTEGYLDLMIRNTGSEDGKKATVRITRNGASMVIPTDSSVFVGDFPRGGTISCRYKVAVSGNAEEQTYPVDVSVTYENGEGATVTSAPYTIGIPVGSRTGFVVTSGSARVTAGTTTVITVDYRNDGSTTVYQAQARISAVDPFMSNDNTAYLGDLRPGGLATAKYDMRADPAAAPKEYALDSEVRYRDALGNSQVSDTVKVNVQVMPGSGGGNPLTDPLTLCLVAAVIISAGYYVLKIRPDRK
jgi:hypothetical protein